MASTSTSSAPQVGRPGCIAAYAIVLWLGGVLLIVYAWSLVRQDFWSALQTFAAADGSTLVLGTLGLFGTVLAPACLGLFVLVTGFDLWRMKYWAWLLMVFLHLLSLVLMLVGLFLNLNLLGPAGSLYSLVLVRLGIPTVGLVISGVINGAMLLWFIVNRRLFDGGAGALVYILLVSVGVVIVIVVMGLLGSATEKVYSGILRDI